MTKFSGMEGINDGVVEEIEEQITELINPTTVAQGASMTFTITFTGQGSLDVTP